MIAKRNRGLNSSFIVRKISRGEGVERTFQTYSPLIASIEVKRRGDVRRAKLYYLRDRSGKSRAHPREAGEARRERGRRRGVAASGHQRERALRRPFLLVRPAGRTHLEVKSSTHPTGEVLAERQGCPGRLGIWRKP